MTIMTKRGNLDNIVTYEHMCDTIEDLNNIDPKYVTLGSTAIVVNQEEGLNAYMANSAGEWISIGTTSTNESSGSSSSGGIIPSGTYNITTNDTYNVSRYATAKVNVPSNNAITLQSITITPDQEAQTILATDQNCDGFDTVKVKAIPSSYILPSGRINIATNGIYDISQYAFANVNVQEEGYFGKFTITFDSSITNNDKKLLGLIAYVDNNNIFLPITFEAASSTFTTKALISQDGNMYVTFLGVNDNYMPRITAIVGTASLVEQSTQSTSILNKHHFLSCAVYKISVDAQVSLSYFRVD